MIFGSGSEAFDRSFISLSQVLPRFSRTMHTGTRVLQCRNSRLFEFYHDRISNRDDKLAKTTSPVRVYL